jgi:uncharacterized protein (DUF1778 family)
VGLRPVGLGNPLAAAGAPLSVGLDLYGSLALPIHWRNIVATEQNSCFEARLPASVFATLKRAAELQGRSLTDFVVSAAHDAPQRAIEQQAILRLSAEDQQRFAEALIQPPAPNAALNEAKRLHLENVEVW